MDKPYMTLQPTEMALLGTAGRIHAARLASGQVPEGARTCRCEWQWPNQFGWLA